MVEVETRLGLEGGRVWSKFRCPLASDLSSSATEAMYRQQGKICGNVGYGSNLKHIL
jgi:hypothetical protein